MRASFRSIAALLVVGALLLPASGCRAQTNAVASAEMVLTALGLLGVPYRFGGNDPATGLDCSGLVQIAVRSALGVELPRQSEAIGRLGWPVDRDEMRPGDLVFFNTLARPFSHVGIYLGDGQFVHAPSERGQVRIEALGLPYWRTRFDGARRLTAIAEATPIPAPRSAAVDDLWSRITP